jgi:tRNA/tmRNA/rRNA uracil-C5-methylase (TrmA/RlmC/RlmD family)
VARLGGEPGTGAAMVVFVRHALPGERVLATITEVRRSYLRADAVCVLRASPDRVVPPCPQAGPGRCGGCDWQHASAERQRAIKTDVVREQFARLAGLDVAELLHTVEPLPGGLLGWRTRTGYAVDRDGHPGLRRHRSHQVQRLDSCPLGAAGVGGGAVLHRSWPGCSRVEAARGDGTEVSLLAHPRGYAARGRRRAHDVELVDGPARLRHRVLGRDFEVSAGGFWQVHPFAAETFATAVREALAPRPGERALDLYAGAGMLTAMLAESVGSRGTVLGIETSVSAVADAARNLTGLPWARVRRGRVEASVLAHLAPRPDIVVLDPPRAGVGPRVMQALLGLHPRSIGYLACDPDALARDVATALEGPWELGSLRAFDAFPMTHHVECLAVLSPTGRSSRLGRP